MPEVLIVAAGAVSALCALRWIRREYDRVEGSLRRTDRRIRRAYSTRTFLVFDSARGFYRR